jgi:hypothetical protein
MKILLVFIVLLEFFAYVILIWDLKKSNQKKFLEYKNMYPRKTDQEIMNLMKEEFSQKEKEYYWDHEGW